MSTQLESWEMAKLDKWCVMCGATPGESCKTISGETAGEARYRPHFYRNSDTKPGVLVKDEPAFIDSDVVLGRCPHGVDLDHDICAEGCRV